MEKANWHVGTLAFVVTSIHLTPSLILMMSNRVLIATCLIITNIDFSYRHLLLLWRKTKQFSMIRQIKLGLKQYAF
jgi:hypothetical protein